MTGKLPSRRIDALRRPPQQLAALGEIAADERFTDFTDTARYVSYWRVDTRYEVASPRRIPALQTSRSAWSARVRCDRRGSVPNVDVMGGMHRGACPC